MYKSYIKSKTKINPLYFYAYSIAFVILLYSLGWSYLLPTLSFGLLCFLWITVIVALFFGFLLNHSSILPKYKMINYTHNTNIVFFILILLIVIEMIYNKGIPLLMLIKGIPYNYMKFGIKTLHVFILTFVAFYTIYLFHLFISTKSKKIFIEFIILFLYPILIIDRGDLIMTLFAIIIVFLLSIKISFKKYFKIILVALIFFYIFGVLGNIRMHNYNYVNYFQPTKNFQNSNVPKPFLWPYIYITSPLGDLQQTIKRGDYIHTLKGFIFASLIPDAISKHFNYKVNKIKKVASFLVVGTMYDEAYANMGWIGMTILFFYLIVFIVLYLILLHRNNSSFAISGYAILLTVVVFNLFSNMIVFSGLSFQLAYPLILGFMSKYKFKLYK